MIAITTPPYENDALEYAESARAIFSLKNNGDYPFINSNQTNGYFGPWSHGLGYTGLIVWSYLIQADSTELIAFRFVPVFYCLFTVLALLFVLRFKRQESWLGPALLLLTFLYFLTTGSGHIESIRIAAFICPIFAWATLRKESLLIRTIITSTVLGLSYYTHSSSILIPAFLGFLITFSKGISFKSKIIVLTALNIISIGMVCSQIMTNIIKFGSPIADIGAVPVYNILSLNYPDYFAISRGFFTPSSRIAAFLKGLIQSRYFGPVYWILIISLIIVYFKSRAENFRRLLNTHFCWVSLAILFYLGAGVATLVGIETFIKNDRYLMTIQIPIIITAALTFSAIRLPKRFTQPILIIVLLCWFYFPLQQLKKTINLYNFNSSNILNKTEFEKISNSDSPIHKAILFLHSNSSEDEIIFSLRQSDLSYYLANPVLSHIDSKMIPFYQSKDLSTAFAFLKRLNVKFIFIPVYAEPVIQNSFLSEILANPTLASIRFNDGGYKIYELKNRNVKLTPVFKFNKSHKDSWLTITPRAPIVPILQSRNKIAVKQFPPETPQIEIAFNPLFPFFFQRATQIAILGPSRRKELKGSDPAVPISPHSEYLYSIKMAGHGKVLIQLIFFDAGNNFENAVGVQEFFLLGNELEKSTNFITEEFTGKARLMFQAPPGSRIEIKEITISKIDQNK